MGGEEECTPGASWTTLKCILTYDGSALDIGLNYSLLAISIGAGIYLLLSSTNSRRTVLAAAIWQGIALIALFAFQLGLCMLVGCAGVSIIWNAIDGFMGQQLMSNTDYSERKKAKQLIEPPERARNPLILCVREPAIVAVIGSILVGFIVDVYYACTLPAITTVAHISAIVLGIAIGFIYSFFPSYTG